LLEVHIRLSPSPSALGFVPLLFVQGSLWSVISMTQKAATQIPEAGPSPRTDSRALAQSAIKELNTVLWTVWLKLCEIRREEPDPRVSEHLRTAILQLGDARLDLELAIEKLTPKAVE